MNGHTKMKLYKVIAVLVLTYTGESWTITGQEKRRIQTASRLFKIEKIII